MLWSALPNHDRSLAAELEGTQVVSSTAAAADTFPRVFHAYAGYVISLLRRVGVHEADVEDVAQEVFMIVHAQLASFEGRSTLKTWISGICLRKASDYRRKAHRRRELAIGALPEEASDGGEQEAQLERKQHSTLLERALQHLTEKQLQVFVLYEIEELSMAEVAQALGCPRFTAYTRLHAARRALRAWLDKTGRATRRT
jgi:RNA polymerase sigma-70 factor (ECF subfamily)